MNLFRLPCGIPWGGARRLVLTLACLFALSGLSAQNVTLRFERAKLKTVMDEITRQCDLSFAYSREVVDADRIVSIDLKDAPIDAALQSLFPSGNGIDYAIKNRKILLSAGKQSLHVDTVVSGRVADDQNRPLVGATVVVAGTSQGTTTDLDGNFSLRVNAVDPVLKVDYLGYEPQELRVSPSQTTFDIRLALSSKAIDDVVVVGYGTVKRRDLVGAVDQVDRKVIEDRSTGTLARALQGQLPGLNITFTDSKPTRGASVNVRGSGSIGAGGSTLVLIDGVEGSINAINPQDVESVSVLKDASSSAVYGARGAFGGVLITTKSAKKGTPVINYTGSVTITRRTVTPDVVTDGLTWINWWKDCYNGYYNGSKALLNHVDSTIPYTETIYQELIRRSQDPSLARTTALSGHDQFGWAYYDSTDWHSLFYKDYNWSTEHNLSISGGGDQADYYISGRFYDMDGIYKVGEETYKKYNLRAKGSIRIRPWLTLDNNTSLMSSKYHQPMVHYGQQVISRQIDMFAFPFALLKNPDGTWTQTAAKTGYAAFAEGTSWQENNKLEVANTTTFNFEFVPDVFKVSADVTYKGSRWSRDRMENLYTYYTGVNVSGQDNSFSSLENWTYRSDYISTNIVGTVTPKLGADHDLNVVAGWNLEDYDYRTQKTYRQGNLYPSKPSFTLMDGEYYSTTSGGYTWGLVGFFGRVNYAYAGRYLAEVSARYDGSSKFPSSSQWGFFPSASVGWRLSEEPWLKPHVEGWLDNFKVRASIGSLGNANIDPYQYLETMTASGSASIAKSSVIINGQNVPYTSVPSLIPDDITWEKVTTYNIGLDLDLFHNRLSFTGDYYRRNTTDLYTVGPNLPQVLGSAAPYGNYASLKTKGWELSLSWRDSFNLGGKPFSYSIKGMLWDSRSWITDYYNETGDLTTYYKGMEIGEIWGFRTAGIYASNADALNGPAYNFFKNGEMFRAYAGDLRFVDVDGDGIMTKGNRTLSNHGDLEIIGNQSPRYQYSINMSLNWNGIGLSMLWQGVGKRDWYPWTESGFFWGKWNRAYNSLMKTQTGDNVVRIDKSTDNWRVTNMDKNPYWTRMVSLAANRNDGPLTWENDHYLQDASYIRLKNITIDYTFPKHICKKLRLEGLKVYLSGENLFTHSPMFKHTDMFDPEVITSGDSDFAASTTSGLNGTGNGYSYPMLKTVTLGINVTF